MMCAYNVKYFYGQVNITDMNPKASCGVSYPPLMRDCSTYQFRINSLFIFGII